MSDINGRQQIGHGRGGLQAAVDGKAFANGGWAGWIDDLCGFFANADDEWVCSTFEPQTNVIERAVKDTGSPFYGRSMNDGYAGGGRWAAWLRGFGVFTSDGLFLDRAGLLGVGPGGELVYKPDYYSGGPTMCREMSNADAPDKPALEWMVTPGHATSVRILGRRQAIWTEGDRIRTLGIPAPQQIGMAAWRPYAFMIGGRWWITYQSDTAGIVLHPVDDCSRGHVIVPAGVSCWHSARAFGTFVLFALFSGEAEQPGQLSRKGLDLATVPAEALPQGPPIVDVPPMPDPTPQPPAPQPGGGTVDVPNVFDIFNAAIQRHPDKLARLVALADSGDQNGWPSSTQADHAAMRGELMQIGAYDVWSRYPEWGLLKKDGQSGIQRADGNRIATDILVYKPTMNLVDVFDDRRPIWSPLPDTDTRPTNYWLQPLPMGDAPPVTPPVNPPPDPGNPPPAPVDPPPPGITDTLAKIAQRLDAIESQLKKGYTGTAKYRGFEADLDLTPK